MSYQARRSAAEEEKEWKFRHGRFCQRTVEVRAEDRALHITCGCGLNLLVWGIHETSEGGENGGQYEEGAEEKDG